MAETSSCVERAVQEDSNHDWMQARQSEHIHWWKGQILRRDPETKKLSHNPPN